MTTILAIIDGGREPAYRRSWPVALRLAEREGATLLLADRSAETWGETPHHSGPFSPEKYRAMGRHHSMPTSTRPPTAVCQSWCGSRACRCPSRTTRRRSATTTWTWRCCRITWIGPS